MEHEPSRLEQTASLLWELAQQKPTYPVPLEEIVGWALPLALFKAPDLTIQYVYQWLQANGLAAIDDGRMRRLRGCLFAHHDHGVIFLDCVDPPDEQRFTLAHEVAHFLLDYWFPRRRTLRALGETIRPVLDGWRAPTAEERLHALLANTPLGVVKHLMERPDEGLPSSAVLAVETRADRLALEILAPAALLSKRYLMGASHLGYAMRIQRLTTALVNDFGLPTPIAESYARRLLRQRGGPTVRDWLLGTDA